MAKTPSHLFAYIDTISGGLVPCIVTGLSSFQFGDRGTNWPNVTCKVTAARPGYPKGEVVKSHPRYVWPRDVIFRKRGSDGLRWIVPAYSWQERLERCPN